MGIGLGLGNYLGLSLGNSKSDSSLPEPDALFDTRTGLVLRDSIGGLTANLKDFPVFNWKSSPTQLTSGTSSYHPTSSGDITVVTFIKPTQSTTNYVDIKGFGDYTSNYIRISNTAKTAVFNCSGVFVNTLTFPDSGNYTSNIYMLVWKYKADTQVLTGRIYNTSSNYAGGTKSITTPYTGNSSGLQYKQTVKDADMGLILQAYYTRDLNDSEITGIWNGTIPSNNLTSLTSFTHGDGLLTHTFDTVGNVQYQFTAADGSIQALPRYDLLLTNIHAAYPLIYGYTKRATQNIGYGVGATKLITGKVGDIECPNNIMWNMATCRMYCDSITDATVKAIFDKSNRTYWKSSIESEGSYIDIGSGYYGAWQPEQLQRDFILTHAQTGHENHIFSSLRVDGAVVTGISAIRIYKINVQ